MSTLERRIKVPKSLSLSLIKLSHSLRELRLQEEQLSPTPNNMFAVRSRMSDDAAFSDVSMRTVQAIVDGTGDSELLGMAMPASLKVVQSLKGPKETKIAAVAVRAPMSFARRLRATQPAVHVAPVRWLFPQHVDPLGLQLARFEIIVAPNVKGRTLEVMVTDPSGQAQAGIQVRAVVDAAVGTNIPAVTNAQGIASLRIPTKYPTIEAIFATPKHTYWPCFVVGFARGNMPATPMPIGLTPVWPDPYGLLAKYGKPHDTAGEKVKVGVIDTGVGPHKDLVLAGGQNLVSGDGELFTDNGVGHGTHVAGIIGARGVDGGMVGVAPRCALMSYRVCSSSGANYDKAKSTDVASALLQAINDGCDLVNISLGNTAEMPEVQPLLHLARERGMVVLAAMGNDGKAMARFPARYEEVIGVAAMGRLGTFPVDSSQALVDPQAECKDEFVPDFSNFGPGTDFIGPGYGVISTFPEDRYAVMNGTSMATPYITGMTARLLSFDEETLTMPRNATRAAAILKLATKAAKLIGFPYGFEGNGVVR